MCARALEPQKYKRLPPLQELLEPVLLPCILCLVFSTLEDVATPNVDKYTKWNNALVATVAHLFRAVTQALFGARPPLRLLPPARHQGQRCPIRAGLVVNGKVKGGQQGGCEAGKTAPVRPYLRARGGDLDSNASTRIQSRCRHTRAAGCPPPRVQHGMVLDRDHDLQRHSAQQTCCNKELKAARLVLGALGGPVPLRRPPQEPGVLHRREEAWEKVSRVYCCPHVHG